MNIPDDDSSPIRPRRPLWLLVVPVLAAVIGAGFAAAHRPIHLQQALGEFRGEGSLDAGPNQAMVSAILIRQAFLLHPRRPLSPKQSTCLIGLINSPVDEQSQSEALDVLSMAKRTHALLPPEARKAEKATLLVLTQSPGPMVRVEGARFLGHLRSKDSVPALTKLQTDPDPRVREAAEEALTQVQK